MWMKWNSNVGATDKTIIKLLSKAFMRLLLNSNAIHVFTISLSLLQFEELGLVTSIESNHKNVPSARKGMEVCIKIDPIPGVAPKMFGRHFDETDILCSKVSPQHANLSEHIYLRIYIIIIIKKKASLKKGFYFKWSQIIHQ